MPPYPFLFPLPGRDSPKPALAPQFVSYNLGAEDNLENGLTVPPFRVLVMTCDTLSQAAYPMPGPGDWHQLLSWALSVKSAGLGIGASGLPLRPAMAWSVTSRERFPSCRSPCPATWSCCLFPVCHELLNWIVTAAVVVTIFTVLPLVLVLLMITPYSVGLRCRGQRS